MGKNKKRSAEEIFENAKFNFQIELEMIYKKIKRYHRPLYKILMKE